MMSHRLLKGLSFASAALVTALGTHSACAQLAATTVAPGTRVARDLGFAEPSKDINITVHLKLPDQPGFDKAVDQLYEKGSPTYHKWMTAEDLKKYAPTEAQRQAVVKELERNGLSVTPSSESSGFTIRAHGPTASVANAFNTQIHQFSHNGRSFRANVYEAKMNGEAANYIASVSGIESHQARPLLLRSRSPKTGQPYTPIPVSKIVKSKTNAGPDLLTGYSTTTCLTGPVAIMLEYGNVPPVADYVGNLYNPPLPCAYTPQQLQAVYHMSKAYNGGFDGTGQTIALIEAYGSPTILSDANTFFSLAGLPPLTSSNFQIVYPQGPPADPNAGVLLGWNIEIALDVEYAHSIAPGAKIVLVAASGQDDEDLQDAVTYAVNNHYGNSFSNSYELDLDDIAGSLEETSWDAVLKYASAQGVSVNFSTGDSGDDGLGTPIGAAGVPSNSPHATAVGGTSILNLPGSTTGQTVTTGWGDSLVALSAGSTVLDPPEPAGFFGGSGGGQSIFFPKPSWQASLPGTGRQTPDISALADPQTGVPIIFTQGGVQVLAYYGGTSLACPIFSGMWAIGNQYAGFPLGQAAPLIALLGNSHIPYIQDVLPTNPASAYNVHGTIFDSNGSTTYSPTALFSGLEYGNTGFTSAIFPFDPGDVDAIGFGLDTSLTVTPGWDNVTGWGTPNLGAMGGILLP